MPEGTETLEAKPLKEIVPAEFHDRPYLKDLLDKPQGPEAFAEVFKKLDGAEKLVGKKVGIPESDKPEDWDGFLAKLRPEKEDDYEIATREGARPDPELAKMLKSAFHAAGLNKVQAAKFQAKIAPAIEAREKAMVEQQKKIDEEFTALSEKAFGADRDKVYARVNAAIKENVPAEFHPHLDKLDNKSLVILAGVVNSVLKKYVPADKLDGGAGAGATGGDGGDLREEGRKLMASEAYSNWQHPDHEKTVSRVNEIYKTIGASMKK